MPPPEYDHAQAEARWQARWRDERVFEATPPAGRPKHYVLEMLPYPSGRLHIGHVRNYTMGDVLARFQRLRGKAVMYAIGWDALGLPAENAAIERGADAREWTLTNIAAMRGQLQNLGLSYDWSREVASCLPDYYRWNQWFFLKFLEAGLAYRKKQAVQWCSKCKTVLANEQVEDGLCYRCETPVVARELEQWFLRTTEFQDEMLDALDELPGWPEGLRTRQRNWIGRSRGAQVTFPVVGHDAKIEVFTTRLDTIDGCTFVVIAPDHPVLDSLGLDAAARARIDAFAREQATAHVAERGEDRDKEGLPTGAFATNPFTGEKLPIWTANFVVKNYGTGAVMSVPAHDLRDLEFARKYGLPIVPVIRREDATEPEAGYTEDGILALPAGRSGAPCNGLTSAAAREALVAHGEKLGFARAATVHRLRDWGISRQRYWGTPIPIIHCAACGTVPVPESDLPVLLPDRIELTGEASPLARHAAFANVPCPRCGRPARREPDTMDTFIDSSWYFFRYLDPKNEKAPFSAEAVAAWMPVDVYIGGPEHAVGHLIYCRWWARAMKAIGLAVPEEPIRRLIHHGMVTNRTLKCPEHGWRGVDEVDSTNHCRECGKAVIVNDAAKMSKAWRNGIEPDDYVARFGADTLRLFTMFTAPPGKEIEWSDDAVLGMYRFLHRVWRQATRNGLREVDPAAPASTPEGEQLENALHRAIHRVTVDLDERLHVNTGISTIMELSNAIAAHSPSDQLLPADAGPVRRAVEGMLVLLSPYAPHLAEEAWSQLGRSTLIARASWPVADPKRLIESTVVVAVQVNGKLRGELELPRDASQDAALLAAKANNSVARWIEGQDIVKVVHVPNRLLNLVVKPSRSAS